ncbi:hypothetical protein DES36_11184 [Alkalibaculum bacchi]|uniref:TolB protein n=1 Tax=Alkalibaculum bacchi TaxID=645887 RepID=A0A366I3X1_9FIRM|nr:hypothetical protein [Alkalibaculum bacchi]RBP62651.1 hypothetical protein DES36_11184 [Alkalibaculum bacchi]
MAIKKLFIVLLIFLISTGCSPIFLKENNPVVLDNSTGLNENQTLIQNAADESDRALIKNIDDNLTQGLVYDISNDGELLLMGIPTNSINANIKTTNSYSNLYTYNIKNKQQKQILLSSKEQSNAVFDEKNKGMIYVEYNKDADGRIVPDSYKLNWTDYEGSQTKNISLTEESVSPKFSLIDDDLLIYGNSKGQIQLVKTSNIVRKQILRDTYTLTNNLSIYKIDCFDDYKLAFFLAMNPTTNAMDLYYVVLDEKEIEPVLMQSNVTDFSLSKKDQSILYSVTDKNQTVLMHVDMYYNKQVLYKGPMSMFYLTPNENQIIYREKVDESSNNQNLWIMNTDGSKSMQLASNLKIASDKIVFSPDMQTIYFSVLYLKDSESNTKEVLKHRVYAIDFSNLKK